MRIWMTLLCLAFLGCSQPQSPAKSDFIGVDISGGAFAQDFRLVDHRGRAVSMRSFRGKVVAIFFGYTHCPDVCPTTMSDLAKVVRSLGARQSEVQVLFVTLDPARDTPQVLAKFVPSFHPDFLGLYGTEAEIGDVARSFKIFYQKQAAEGRSGYTIDHTAGVYVFGRDGRPRLYLNYGEKPQEMEHDIRLLM